MIRINSRNFIPIEQRDFEICERKGLGHPDTLIDGVMEELSIELSKRYLKEFGRIAHFNVDKGQVCGGATKVEFGGGEFTKPIFFLLGGRATPLKGIEISDLAEETTDKFIKKNTRFLKKENYEIESRISKGALELRALLKPKIPLANDTSVCVGFAPQSELEKIVLSIEKDFNSNNFKKKYPEIGEDIKVMGLRTNNKIQLTVAAAFVSKYIKSLRDYRDKKERLAKNISGIVEKMTDRKVNVVVNKADKGKNVYLTLTGLSCEMGDDGNTGRGNRANGLITPCRPMSIESTAGKNPVNHVGKVYSVLAFKIADEIVQLGAKECNIYLQSRIGTLINKPAAAIADILWEKEEIKKNKTKIERMIKENLNQTSKLSLDLIHGKISVF